jgi:hypothetical protein
VTVVGRWVATAVVVPLLVAGCSDDPEPKFEPSPSPSPSESTSEPAEPKAWEVKSEAGAVAFAKHWIEVFNEAKSTGDTAELEEMSAETCTSCTNFVNFLNQLYGHGGRFESTGWHVKEVSDPVSLRGSKAGVSMRIRQSPERVHRANPPEVEHFPGGLVTYSAGLEWRNGNWVMTRLDLMT